MNRLKPELVLRLSLAATYLYSGYSLFKSPKSWTQFVPQGLKEFLVKIGLEIVIFVQAQGLIELTMAAVLLLWFLPVRLVKWVALISTLELALILIFTGIDLVTFRDIAILGSSLAVFLIYRERK